MEPNTVVLRGNGPTMRVTVKDTRPVKMLIVTKSKARQVTLTQSSDVRFAA